MDTSSILFKTGVAFLIVGVIVAFILLGPKLIKKLFPSDGNASSEKDCTARNWFWVQSENKCCKFYDGNVCCQEGEILFAGKCVVPDCGNQLCPEGQTCNSESGVKSCGCQETQTKCTLKDGTTECCAKGQQCLEGGCCDAASTCVGDGETQTCCASGYNCTKTNDSKKGLCCPSGQGCVLSDGTLKCCDAHETCVGGKCVVKCGNTYCDPAKKEICNKDINKCFTSACDFLDTVYNPNVGPTFGKQNAVICKNKAGQLVWEQAQNADASRTITAYVGNPSCPSEDCIKHLESVGVTEETSKNASIKLNPNNQLESYNGKNYYGTCVAVQDCSLDPVFEQQGKTAPPTNQFINDGANKGVYCENGACGQQCMGSGEKCCSTFYGPTIYDPSKRQCESKNYNGHTQNALISIPPDLCADKVDVCGGNFVSVESSKCKEKLACNTGNNALVQAPYGSPYIDTSRTDSKGNPIVQGAGCAQGYHVTYSFNQVNCHTPYGGSQHCDKLTKATCTNNVTNANFGVGATKGKYISKTT
jgi:hypothetical protein